MAHIDPDELWRTYRDFQSSSVIVNVSRGFTDFLQQHTIEELVSSVYYSMMDTLTIGRWIWFKCLLRTIIDRANETTDKEIVFKHFNQPHFREKFEHFMELKKNRPDIDNMKVVYAYLFSKKMQRIQFKLRILGHTHKWYHEFMETSYEPGGKYALMAEKEFYGLANKCSMKS